MSNREDFYEEFKNSWDNVQTIQKELADSFNYKDEPDISLSLARILKAINYLNTSINNLDYQLLPLELLKVSINLFKSLEAALSKAINDISVVNIESINNQIDSILSKLIPYFKDSITEIDALKSASNSYIDHLTSKLESYDNKYNELIKKLIDTESELSETYQKINSYKEEIHQLHNDYLIGSDEDLSLKDKLQQLSDNIEEQSSDIKNFYNELFINDDSIKSEIEHAATSIIDYSNEALENKEALSSQLNDLKIFYDKVFGTPDEDGEVNNGLKFEIERRKNELESLKKSQIEQFKARDKQIESLLPGATSAGLASAYHDLSESFNDSIKNNSRYFYVAIVFLAIVSFITTIQNFSLFPLKIDFVELNTISNLGGFLLLRLMVILPVVWFAIFSSKRRSEAERLKQEYAHKAALAKSYQSFKLQIEQLEESDGKEPLLEKLLDSSIDTIALNASNTLDKKHGDNLPLADLISRISEKTVEKTLNKLPTHKIED